MRKIKIITPLIVTALLLFGACVPTQEPEEPEQPSHEQLNFQLSTNTTPGNTDEYDSHIFNLYLEQEQELALDFSAQGAAVMVSLFTPSEEIWGYSPPPPSTTTTEDGETGYLKKGRTVATEEGSFRFTVPESGYYIVTIKSATPKGEIEVLVEYQIQ